MPPDQILINCVAICCASTSIPNTYIQGNYRHFAPSDILASLWNTSHSDAQSQKELVVL